MFGEKTRNIAFLLLIFLFFLSSIYLGRSSETSLNENILAVFKEEDRAFVAGVENLKNQNILLIESIRGLFRASEIVDREEWNRYVESISLSKSYPGIRGVEFVRKIDRSEVDYYESKVTKETGIDNIKIEPFIEKEDYYIVDYLYPLENNERALLLDLSFSESRLEGLSSSADLNLPVLTGPVVLVQEDENSSLLSSLLLLPVYDNNAESLKTIEERRGALVGYSVAVINFRDFFNHIKDISLNDDRVVININDITEDQPINIYRYEGVDIKDKDYIQTSNIITFGGRRFEVNFQAPREIYLSNIERIFPDVVTWGGISFSILLIILWVTLLRSNTKAKLVADKMSKKYEEAERRLKNNILQIKENERKLKKALENTKKQKEEVDKLNKLMVGREIRMIELKKEIGRYKK